MDFQGHASIAWISKVTLVNSLNHKKLQVHKLHFDHIFLTFIASCRLYFLRLHGFVAPYVIKVLTKWIYNCIIWQQQYERSDWLMSSNASRVLPFSLVNTDPYGPLTTFSKWAKAFSLSFTIQTKMKTLTAMRKFRRSEDLLLRVMMKTRNYSLNHLLLLYCKLKPF